MGLPPPAPRLLVALGEVGEEGPQLAQPAGVVPPLGEEPEELVEVEAAVGEGILRELADLAVQEPVVGVPAQFGEGEGPPRIRERKRSFFHVALQNGGFEGRPDAKEAVCSRLYRRNC